ncbi:MAG: ABC-2 family transporter protein [Blautia sp.]|nr:ABC-2 family transporter protein [Blautia sp.]MCM1202439.1 ABC-2 family transporter protein [Bacteroides fragilis]
MKKYLSFFRLRFSMGLQYRAAALAGIVTQFTWGLMEIMVFYAFYRSDASAFPMTLSATSSYVWLQQAFLAFFMAWMMEGEIFDSIINGNIAYELCRPIDLYNMWFARSIANRLSRAVLRCFPILLVAAFIPEPYGIAAPAGPLHFLLFVITLILGLLVMVSFCMLVYVLTFFTVSPQGLRILFNSTVEFFSGALIPLPFFPEKVRQIMELLPFAAMQNVALRIYSGSMNRVEMEKAIVLQIFWLAVITLTGKKLCKAAERRVIVQGG